MLNWVIRMKDDQSYRLRSQFSDPFLTALTILFALLLFVIAPLQAAGLLAAHYFGLAFGMLLLVAAFIVSGSAVAVTGMFIAIALIATATILRLRHPSHVDILLEATAWLIFNLIIGVVVARAVFSAGRITMHRVVGAILLYLNIGVTFVSLFCFVALLQPEAFAGIGPLKDDLRVSSQLIYFSFVTLTSVGYGDIAPVHPFARSLANVEAIIGQLYPATLLARLVTLELEGRRNPK